MKLTKDKVQGKMDPVVKEDWVEALRSGEYYQAESFLDSDNGQCCLGVLCDILDEDWTILEYNTEDSSGNRMDIRGVRVYGSDNYSMPSYKLLNKVGLTDRTALTLATMNDEGATFKEIADYIEAVL